MFPQGLTLTAADLGAWPRQEARAAVLADDPAAAAYHYRQGLLAAAPTPAGAARRRRPGRPPGRPRAAGPGKGRSHRATVDRIPADGPNAGRPALVLIRAEVAALIGR